MSEEQLPHHQQLSPAHEARVRPVKHFIRWFEEYIAISVILLAAATFIYNCIKLRYHEGDTGDNIIAVLGSTAAMAALLRFLYRSVIKQMKTQVELLETLVENVKILTTHYQTTQQRYEERENARDQREVARDQREAAKDVLASDRHNELITLIKKMRV